MQKKLLIYVRLFVYSIISKYEFVSKTFAFKCSEGKGPVVIFLHEDFFFNIKQVSGPQKRGIVLRIHT